MLRKGVRTILYCIILMTFFNYIRHTCQDAYITFLCTDKSLNWKAAYSVGIITMAGACIGSMALGYFSQWVGRRRTIFGAATISLFMVLLYFQPGDESSLFASGFSRQFYIHGAWGVIQIHLNELSLPSFRAFIPG